MILRPTKIEDISRVIDIINQAKTYFKNNDIDQQQKDVHIYKDNLKSIFLQYGYKQVLHESLPYMFLK